MSAVGNNHNYLYLFLEPGYYGRFPADRSTPLERFDEKAKVWKVEDNERLIRQFNEESTPIKYEDFKKAVGQ